MRTPPILVLAVLATAVSLYAGLARTGETGPVQYRAVEPAAAPSRVSQIAAPPVRTTEPLALPNRTAGPALTARDWPPPAPPSVVIVGVRSLEDQPSQPVDSAFLPSPTPVGPARVAEPVAPAAPTLPPTNAWLPPPPPQVSPPQPAVPDNHACPKGKCEKHVPCYGVYGDGLYLKVRGDNVNYARQQDAVTPLAVPVGPLGAVETPYSPGFRIGGFYDLDDKSNIEAHYTFFQSQAHSRVTAQPGAVIESLVTFPSTVSSTTDSLQASANLDISFHMGDADYRHCICSGCNYYLDWLAGVRYVHMDDNFNSVFSILGTTQVETTIKFDGAGPRAGLEGERISCRGLLLYGRSSANLLVGHFGSSYSQSNSFAGRQAQLNFDDDRIVPILDLELGTGWTNKTRRVRVEAGYYVMGWFNMVTPSGLMNSIQDNNFSRNGGTLKDTITFDGLTARLLFKF